MEVPDPPEAEGDHHVPSHTALGRNRRRNRLFAKQIPSNSGDTVQMFASTTESSRHRPLSMSRNSSRYSGRTSSSSTAIRDEDFGFDFNDQVAFYAAEDDDTLDFSSRQGTQAAGSKLFPVADLKKKPSLDFTAITGYSHDSDFTPKISNVAKSKRSSSVLTSSTAESLVRVHSWSEDLLSRQSEVFPTLEEDEEESKSSSLNSSKPDKNAMRVSPSQLQSFTAEEIKDIVRDLSFSWGNPRPAQKPAHRRSLSVESGFASLLEQGGLLLQEGKTVERKLQDGGLVEEEKKESDSVQGCTNGGKIGPSDAAASFSTLQSKPITSASPKPVLRSAGASPTAEKVIVTPTESIHLDGDGTTELVLSSPSTSKGSFPKPPEPMPSKPFESAVGFVSKARSFLKPSLIIKHTRSRSGFTRGKKPRTAQTPSPVDSAEVMKNGSVEVSSSLSGQATRQPTPTGSIQDSAAQKPRMAGATSLTAPPVAEGAITVHKGGDPRQAANSQLALRSGGCAPSVFQCMDCSGTDLADMNDVLEIVQTSGAEPKMDGANTDAALGSNVASLAFLCNTEPLEVPCSTDHLRSVDNNSENEQSADSDSIVINTDPAEATQAPVTETFFPSEPQSNGTDDSRLEKDLDSVAEVSAIPPIHVPSLATKQPSTKATGVLQSTQLPAKQLDQPLQPRREPENAQKSATASGQELNRKPASETKADDASPTRVSSRQGAIIHSDELQVRRTPSFRDLVIGRKSRSQTSKSKRLSKTSRKQQQQSTKPSEHPQADSPTPPATDEQISGSQNPMVAVRAPTTTDPPSGNTSPSTHVCHKCGHTACGNVHDDKDIDNSRALVVSNPQQQQHKDVLSDLVFCLDAALCSTTLCIGAWFDDEILSPPRIENGANSTVASPDAASLMASPPAAESALQQ